MAKSLVSCFFDSRCTPGPQCSLAAQTLQLPPSLAAETLVMQQHQYAMGSLPSSVGWPTADGLPTLVGSLPKFAIDFRWPLHSLNVVRTTMAKNSTYEIVILLSGHRHNIMAMCWKSYQLFTARCYASAVLAMALCLSVRPSVCPSQVGVLLKRLNLGSHKQHHTIVQGL